MSFKKYLSLSIAAALALIFISCSPEPIKVGCIGDSITEGYGLKSQGKQAYPVYLDSLLGEDYTVMNFGRSAATMTRKGNFPYWRVKELSNLFRYEPELIVIKLGTNDSKPRNWNATAFELDYQSLIDTLLTNLDTPQVYLCLPAPAFETVWGINDSTITEGIIPIIKKLSEKNDLPLIDLYHPLLGQSENFPDAIHPNEKATMIMARVVADVILNPSKE